MSTIVPQLTLNLTGNNQVKTFSQTYNLTAVESIEQSIYLKSSDGDHVLDIVDTTGVEMIIFKSSAKFTIKFTVDAVTFPIEVNNIFTFNPSSTFWATVDSVSISTSATANQLIEYRVYGSGVTSA